MKSSDLEEVIEKMRNSSDAVRKHSNSTMKVFRRKNKTGTSYKSYKNRIGRHMNLSQVKVKVGE
jgi:hypothetical protein